MVSVFGPTGLIIFIEQVDRRGFRNSMIKFMTGVESHAASNHPPKSTGEYRGLFHLGFVPEALHKFPSTPDWMLSGNR